MEIESDGEDCWTVTNEDGVKVHVLRNNSGQYILSVGTSIAGIEPEMAEALIHLAKEGRL